MPDRGTAHEIRYADPFDGAFNIEVSVHKSHKASLRASSMQQTRDGIYKKTKKCMIWELTETGTFVIYFSIANRLDSRGPQFLPGKTHLLLRDLAYVAVLRPPNK